MTITSKRILALTTLATVTASGHALAEGRNNSIEAGATFVGDHEMYTLGYSRDVGNNIVTGGGIFVGSDAIDMPVKNDQDAWGMYANIGYRFELVTALKLLSSISFLSLVSTTLMRTLISMVALTLARA